MSKTLQFGKKGKIEMMIPYQLDSIQGKEGIIDFLVIKNMEDKKELNVDLSHFLDSLQT